MHALRRPDGNARSRARDAVDAGSILGVQQLRPPFLDDVPAAQPRQTQTGRRTCTVTLSDFALDDPDEDDDDFDQDDDESEEEDDDDEDAEDEDVETWQVHN